jgi:hypothetical protein
VEDIIGGQRGSLHLNNMREILWNFCLITKSKDYSRQTSTARPPYHPQPKLSSLSSNAILPQVIVVNEHSPYLDGNR